MSHYTRRRSRSSPLGSILILLILLGAGVFLVWKFFPMVSTSRFSRFDRFNLALATPKVALISLDKTSKTAVVVLFPDNLHLTETYHGYGQYEVNKIYTVGELDHRGGEVLAGTLEEFLGIPIDTYWQSTLTFNDTKKFFRDPQVLLNGKSSLSLFDRLQFALAIFQMRFDKIKVVDLGSLASPLILADGSKALFIEKDILDNQLGGLFYENTPREENLRLTVVNSTEYDGLGNRAARILGNIGTTVVSVSSTSPTLPTCQVISSLKARSSVTLQRIINTFKCALLNKEEDDRADLTIILGEDYVNRLTK